MRSKIILGLLLGGLFVVATLAAIPNLAIANENESIVADKNGSVDQVEEFCGTRHDPAEIAAAENATKARKGKMKAPVESTAPGDIDVHFHIIHHGDRGNVSDAAIGEQMQALNSAYAPHGFTFNLASVERVDDPAWFYGCYPGAGTEIRMKNALRVGSADDLNVYTCKIEGGLVGWATFPQWYSVNPFYDGVVLHYGVLPYQVYPSPFQQPYKEEVLVHETGHWLGLYHTFQGGCDGDGDFVDDTPYEAAPAPFCPIGLDTCPSEGLDPTHNYMDYSGDACWTEFTGGQKARMSEQFSLYRAEQ